MRKNTLFKKWLRRNIITRAVYIEATNEVERVKREAKKQDIQGIRKLIYSIARNYRKRKTYCKNHKR